MTVYAVANLQNINFNAGIVEYLHRIDATLEPFQGKFIIHGGVQEVIEGDWDGTLIVIAFPDRDHAQGWYDSAAYQQILHLRTDNSEGVALVVEGVDADHKATDVLVGI